MGATSVTGVSGHGSAEGHGVKGPHNGRDIYLPIVGPHVVCAGNVTLSAGAAQVDLPDGFVKGSHTGYSVFLQPINGAVNANETVVVAMVDDSDGNFDFFTVAGTGTEVVMWMVVKNGYGV